MAKFALAAPKHSSSDVLELAPTQFEGMKPRREERVTGLAQFRLDVSVTARRGGLTLERAHLAAHLAYQVAEPLEVLLGRGESPLGAFLAAAVLQDAGRLFNDGATVLGIGRQDGVELALADDHVLLATDARVAQELLHVEEPTGRAVDGVLRVSVSKERARDRHFRAVDGQATRGVVQGQGHLGSSERRRGWPCP